ncbi:hypothetical protein HU200_028061 [Digitaria exilis]|uniref:Patatin n=1 Tax=Digitaria exilis TaxID=1010633 RepID=A0A835C6R2_9POAL|nr:hypothetical protein HU200_028061 [Digitaria exilis]CAB3451914.1 unnamed protein product [Digitaria exilis]
MELAGGLSGAKDDDAASRLTYEIFSLLEAKFLFGAGDVARRHLPGLTSSVPSGKVCVLSIDGGARASDGLLAAAALVRLEASLRRRSGNPAGRLPDFFDVAAGSGAGGVLAALLFARGPLGRPLYSADDALAFLLRRLRHRRSSTWSSAVVLRRGGGSSSAAAFSKAFGELTLRDTVRPLLVPCYDMATRSPFVFSRADAGVSAAHDFRLRDVCAATTASGAAVEVVSVDGGGTTRIRAMGGGGVALGNPTAAAITHVLNNRREFPDAVTIDDLLVLSIGAGEVGGGGRRGDKAPEVARIAAEGVSDMVDQAVAMAFGHSRTSNYIRIQGTGSRRGSGGGRAPRACGGETREQAVWKAEAMLLQKSVESVLFQGRKLAGETNADKLERFARELAKEHARRNQQSTPPLPHGGGQGRRSPADAAVVVSSPAVIPSSSLPAPVTNAKQTSTPTPAGSTDAAAPTEDAPPRRRRRAAAKWAPPPEDDGRSCGGAR